MKRLFSIIIGIMAFTGLKAGDSYSYLTFEKSDGTTSSVALSDLSMTLDGSKTSLTAVNQSGSQTFTLTDLSKMYFSEGNEGSSTRLKGDVNSDGLINISDVVAVINTIAGIENYQYCDVDNDNNVNISDVVEIINIIAGISTSETVGSDTEESVSFVPALHVRLGNVIYQFDGSTTDTMTFDKGTQVTILDRTFSLSELTSMTVDDSSVENDTVRVNYSDDTTLVYVSGNIAQYVGVSVTGGHVVLTQGGVSNEVTYRLSGNCSDGEFYMTGSYKASVDLDGLTLVNPNGAAINIQDGKRIAVSVKKDTENTLKDGSSSSDKGAFVVKGHAEFKGKGVLNVYASGSDAHGIKSGEYMSVKNCTINVLSSVKDGIHCAEYLLVESGDLNISGSGDDCIQVEIDGTASTGMITDHENEDSGNIYIIGGTLTLAPTADAVKGLKSAGDIYVSGGEITVNQTGSIINDENGLSYPTSIKADGNITISGGTVNITNTADGGKGISADGTITINESTASTSITVKANGAGGTAENESGSTGSETTQSYKVYISLPTSGSGGFGPGGSGQNAWKNPVLYNSSGTMIASLTNTVTKTANNQTVTFYYYDFKDADTSVSYYIKGDNYTSRGTTYTIRSSTFNAPTNGSDVYYSISNSYSTSGSTRTYSLSNVTNTYSGTSDASEENGTAYNAIGLKADGNLTISSGIVKIYNSGDMSKSIKSKQTVYINGGSITLEPSGSMKIINSDASYCTGVKCVDFIQNDGSLTIKSTGSSGRGISATNVTTNGGNLTITSSGAGVTGSSDTYTAKCIKGDTSVKLNAGTITLTASGTGGKGIKSSGTYTMGTTDGNGPTLKVTTTGTSLGGGTSGGGGGFGPPGQQSSGGSSAKGIKVMGAAILYGGTSEVYTSTDGAEGFESKTSVDIQGGQHYFKCYDDCINSAGSISFNGGVSVCYSFGNDAVDSNYGRTGAITIGNGTAFAYTSAGSPEEGFDCDNNSYIQITGTGIGLSAGGAQGGGFGGGSSSSISGAKQGYYFCTSSVSFSTGRYYTLADASGNNLVTFSFDSNVSSTLALLTATGMKSGSKYNVKYSSTAPSNATTSFHGIYIDSNATGTTTAISEFTAQ